MDATSRASSESVPAVRRVLGARLLPAMLVAAVVFVAGGLGLHWIGQSNTDLPPSAVMAREFRAAAAAMERVAWDVDRDDPGARAWTDAWVAFNGQYDARLLATVALLVQMAAAALVLVVLAGRLPAGAFFTLTVIGVAMVAARSAAGPRPLDEAVWAAGLVGWSVLHVALTTGRSLAIWRVALGTACGVVNLLAAPEGIASTAAVLAWHALRVGRDRTLWPACRGLIVSSAVLLAGGVYHVAATGSTEQPIATFPGAVAAAFAWPMSSPFWALVLWAPAVFCLIRVLGGDSRRASLAPLALLSIALVSTTAMRCAAIGTSAQAISLFGLLVNAACFVLWWCTSRRSAESRLVLSWIWLFAVFIGLMHGGSSRSPAPIGMAQRDPATLELRQAVLRGEADGAVDWSDPRVRAILPPSIRAPLALGESADAAWIGRTPDLDGRDHLPAVGTWSADGAAIRGEFVSGWMQTTLPLLEVRFCGTLHPPDMAIVLRTQDGAEIEPWIRAATALEHWRRFNFPAPREPFQLVVRDGSATAWIAVTAPVEIRWAGWVARRLHAGASWLIALGALCGVIALLGAVSLAARTHAAWKEQGAPMFPWHFLPRLLLVCATVYFAYNLDTTAGPNDSGGYLNSAKLLARGQIAAEPPTVFGPGGIDSDPRLHLPITFRVAPDGRIAPEYPVGLPLIIAAFAVLLPWDVAVGATILSHLVLGILLTRTLARQSGLKGGWAWLAAAMIGLSPIYVFEGLQPVSDVPALVWVTAAVVWAWRSREQPRLAVLSGLATALAVMIRPSNVLCFAPVIICLFGHWRQLTWWALAGLPGAAWLAWYQQSLYGSAFATGYGDASTMFGLNFLEPTLQSYARWLPELFTPLVCLAVVGPFLRPVSGRSRSVLGVWVALFVGFYAVYWCTWDTWYNMRFILPAAPAMVVLALLALREMCRRLRLQPFTTESFSRGILPAGVLVGGVILLLVGSGASRRVLFWVHANQEHAVVARWVRDHLPDDAVVFAKHASGALTYYTDLVVMRADRAESRQPEFIDAVARHGRPIYAVTHHWETRGFVWRGGDLGSGYPDLPGRWERLAALWEDRVFVWAWHPDPEPGAKAD